MSAIERQNRMELGSRGMVLIIVLVAIAVLSLAAYTFTELMLTENKAARLVTRQTQARALTESAAEMVRLYLAQTPQSLMEAGGVYSNAARFQAVQVVPDPALDDGNAANRGRFTVIAPLVEQGQVTGVRFGLENESSRLNLNTLLFLEEQLSSLGMLNDVASSLSSGGGSQSQGGQQSGGSQNQSGNSSGSGSSGSSTGGARDLLMALPGMNEEIADAILDWIDEDDEPREFGAEIEYYSGLGYGPKNGPLDTLEELLLVRGVTPDLLFGADSNRNGVIDPSEQSRAYLASATSSDPEVDRGWASYLTLYSKEANLRADGTPRIDLNSEDLETLHQQLATALNADWANFIIAYRQFGPYEMPTQATDEDEGGMDNGDNNDPQSNLSARSPFRLAYYQRPSGGNSGGGGSGSGRGGGSGSGGSGSAGSGSGGGRGGRGSGSGNSGGGRGGSGRGNSSGGNSGGKSGSGNSGQGNSGQGQGNSNQKLEEINASDIQIDFTKPAKTSIKQILDLVGVGVRVDAPPSSGSSGSGNSGSGGSNGQAKQLLVKPVFPDDPGAAATFLPLLMDNVTVNPAMTIPGRININQASRVVLQGIPGMDPQTLEAILANREPELSAERPNRNHETWLYAEGLVDLEMMRQMMPFITGSGNVYRAQIVGYFDQMGPPCRVETVIDASNATTGVPRIVFWRDISNLGRGFGLDILGAGPAQ